VEEDNVRSGIDTNIACLVNFINDELSVALVVGRRRISTRYISDKLNIVPSSDEEVVQRFSVSIVVGALCTPSDGTKEESETLVRVERLGVSLGHVGDTYSPIGSTLKSTPPPIWALLCFPRW
jgi:hypothetical protein